MWNSESDSFPALTDNKITSDGRLSPARAQPSTRTRSTRKLNEWRMKISCQNSSFSEPASAPEPEPVKTFDLCGMQ